MAGVSTLGQALDQIARIQDIQTRFGTLSTQLATGKKTQQFSGLGTDLLTSKRARADFQTIDTFVNNITNAERRINLALNAIEELQAQAENFSAALVGFSQESAHQEGDIVYFDDPATPDVDEAIPVGQTSGDPDADLERLQRLAADIFEFVGDLINERDGRRFVLAGADTDTQPFNDAGLLDSAVSTLLADWKNLTLSNDQLVGALRERDATVDPNAVTDSVVGFSPALSSGNTKDVFVRVDETTEVDITIRGNEKAFRDVLVVLGYFKNENLGPIADVYTPPNAPPAPADVEGAPGADINEQKDNFYAVFNQLVGTFNRALDDIDSLRFKLEEARAQIDTIKKSHISQQNQLLATISNVEDVDINETAVNINQLSIQLDASYRVTARLQELSLVNFF